MGREFTKEETIAYIGRIKKRIKRATNWTPPATIYYKLGDKVGVVQAYSLSEARSLIKLTLGVRSTAGATLEMRRA